MVDSESIPPEFWRRVSHDEFMECIANDGRLTPLLKERLYRMLDIQNPPEGEIEVMVDRAAFERLLKRIERRKR